MMLVALASAAAHARQPAPGVQVPMQPAPQSMGQSVGVQGDVDDPSLRLERYLEARGLDDLIAAHLRQKLKEATGSERIRVAERLGALYVRQLNESTDAARRHAVEGQARELLKSVGEAPAYELRINLLKVTYLRAQQEVERDRLRLAKGEDVNEAATVLREVCPAFVELAGKLDARVDTLERKEESPRGEDVELVRAELTEVRRLRSLARYYAGWANYYLAMVDKNPGFASAANMQFGALLNAQSGKPATPDRVPIALLKYEHVARAAIGCALAAGLRGSNGEAAAWISVLEQAPEVSAAAAEQLTHAKFIIYAGSSRWGDVEATVRELRGGTGGGASIKPLSTETARLLAVLALENADKGSPTPEAKAIMERLAQVALGDLISLGEAGQVLDLVQRFGTAPIGQQGFMGQYIRALQIYDKARETHAAAGNGDDPTRDAVLVGRYRDAATLFDQAAQSTDAAKFAGDRAKALLLRALSLFYANELGEAATVFTAASDAATGKDEKRDALWYAVVALDRAVENGKPSLAPERDRVSVLYLQFFPGTENAVKLLLRRSGDGLVSDEEAARTLLSIEPRTPLFDAARRHASAILFRLFRASPGVSRTDAARRFVEIATGIVEIDERTAAQSVATPEVMKSIDVRTRQIAEAALAMTPPDLVAAGKALDTLERVATAAGVSTASFAGEVLFRRLQIHLARGDDPSAQETLDRLRDTGGSYLPAAERLIYRRRLEIWRASATNPESARELVRAGARVVAQFETAKTPVSEPQVASVYGQLAEAAALVWEKESDKSMLAVAIKMDRDLLDAGVRLEASMRRLGTLAEAAEDRLLALDAWRAMLTAVPADSPAWFEARYHTIRLLRAKEPARAAEAMAQLKLLHPDFGPPAWREKLKTLDEALRNSGAATNAPVVSPSSTGGDG